MVRKDFRDLRWAGLFLLLGALGGGVATLLHPPYLNTVMGRHELVAIAHTGYYGLLHWALLAADLFMGFGLVGLFLYLLRERGLSFPLLSAFALNLLQMALWTGLFVGEATSLIQEAAAYAAMTEESYQELLAILNASRASYEIALGYVAMAMLWVGTLLFSLALLTIPSYPRVLAQLGIAGSLLALLAQGAAPLYPILGHIRIMALLQGPGGAWLFLTGLWLFLRTKETKA
ncbi:MAG: hypothetical protein KM310_08910 [Clostridiales bacterium]|nr:hypothetical protein [Clostridiales bacterium]